MTVGAWPISIKSMSRARGHTVDMHDNVRSATRARGRTFDEPDNRAPGNDRGKATKSARPAMYAVFATTRARDEAFDEPDGSGFRARGKTVDSRPRQMFQQLVGTGDDEVPGACSTNVRPVHAHLCCMPIRLLVVLLA